MRLNRVVCAGVVGLGVLWVSAAVSYAAAPSAAPEFAHITQGHWIANGGVSYAKTPFTGSGVGGVTSYTTLAIVPSLQYFFWDRLALGLNLRFSIFNYDVHTETDFDLGPAATYFFWTQERLAAHFTAGYLFTSAKTTDDSFPSANSSKSGGEGVLSVGLDYFFSPSVSFGPSFTYRILSTPRYAESSGILLAALFGIYL
jgi:hypothetical protein